MPTILIADDEAHIRILAEAIFKEVGYTTYLAVDGQDAIEKAEELKPDIIVTDVIMPNKNGFEVCKAIRSMPEIEQTPIIILSAMGDEYNKITGFEEGADDYVTKPFNVEELKARVKSLLQRFQPGIRVQEPTKEPIQPAPAVIQHNQDMDLVSTGIPQLDEQLSGGFPKGSNILVTGPIGHGKSTFARRFVSSGLSQGERCLFVAIDDDPSQIRSQIDGELNGSLKNFAMSDAIHFVDAYSWSSLTPSEDEPYAVRGMLDLNQLSGSISDASGALGQSVQAKLGGRRVLDSISSLLINFDLPAVQRFISQIARTAVAFGHVTTLFLIEAGTVSEQVMNNIKYVMDGIIEFNEHEGKRAVRVQSMKWIPYKKDWREL